MDNQIREQYIPNSFNKDILPTESSARTWKTRDYLTIWMGSVHNIPNYLVVGGLFALGFSVMQVFSAIMLAAILLALMMVLNGHAGSTYGIPFSIYLRSSFGEKGSIIIGTLRGVIAATFWFGFQTFAGSQAMLILIGKISPSFLTLGGDFNFFGLTLAQLIAFVIFWLFNIVFIIFGVDLLNRFTNILSIFVYVIFGGMAIWAVQLAGGIAPILNHIPQIAAGNEIILFIAGITAIIASWAAPIVNVSDFTRFATSTKAQVVGQSIGLVITYLLFAFASIAIIVGSEIAYGTPIWNVLDVVAYFDNYFAILLAVFTLCLTTLSVNITGNIVPAGYQMAALFPKKLNFKSGAFIISILGLIIMPWKWMEEATSIFTLLNMIGAMLGPVAGVMLAHYFIISKKKLDILSLYTGEGIYRYYFGFNIQAFFTIILTSLPCLLGQFIPMLEAFFQMSWVVGTGSAFILYILLARLFPQKASDRIHN